MFHEHHWTVEEADAACALVAERLRTLRAARLRLSRSSERLEIAGQADISGGAWPGHAYAAAAVQLALGLESLAEADIVVRDLEEGIVDFPAVIDGQEVYLCWREGDSGITHWHAPQTGFAGRRPLSG